MNRPRFLGTHVSGWLLLGVAFVALVWLAALVTLLIEFAHAITAAGGTGCP